MLAAISASQNNSILGMNYLEVYPAQTAADDDIVRAFDIVHGVTAAGEQMVSNRVVLGVWLCKRP